MKRIATACLLTTTLVWLGCDDITPSPPRKQAAQNQPTPNEPTPNEPTPTTPVQATPAQPRSTPTPPVETPPTSPEPTPTPTPTPPTADAPAQPTLTPPVVGAPAPAESGATVQEATAQTGRKGHYAKGIVTTPLAAYWRAGDRLALQQIIHGMQLYVAEHGGPPKTHDEFMEKIFKPLRIELPELDEGQRYVYMPDKVDLPEHCGLMVEQSGPQQ